MTNGVSVGMVWKDKLSNYHNILRELEMNNCLFAIY